MFKSKAFSIVTILVLALAVVAMSCAPAAPAATEPAKPAATEPAKPAATEPAKPAATTPAATTPAAPAPAKLSFEAATFKSDKYGFSLQYPKSWALRTKAGYDFYAQDGDETTADTAFTAIAAKTDDIAGAAKAFLDNSETFKKYAVTCDIVSQKKGTLADGKTPCTQVEMHVTIIIYSINIYAVGANKGDNAIMVIAYTFGTKTDKIKEICNSLAFE